MTISNRHHDVNLRLVVVAVVVVVVEEIPVDGRAYWWDVSLVTIGDGVQNIVAFHEVYCTLAEGLVIRVVRGVVVILTMGICLSEVGLGNKSASTYIIPEALW